VIVDPVTTSVETSPGQIDVSEPVSPIPGIGFTVTFVVAESIHPIWSVPITVNVVETVGVTTSVWPVNPPGFQTYEVPPEADKVVDCPAQTVGGETEALIYGPIPTLTIVLLSQP
jgi:hypothetical protein